MYLSRSKWIQEYFEVPQKVFQVVILKVWRLHKETSVEKLKTGGLTSGSIPASIEN